MRKKTEIDPTQNANPSRKLLLVVDLDYTHFAFHKPGAHWIGSKQFWLDLYKEVSDMVSSQDVELIFVIVSSKDGLDVIVTEAVNAFRPFLEKGNPHMFRSIGGQESYLCNMNQKLCYGYLDRSVIHFSQLDFPTEAFSHVEIGIGLKLKPIQRIAANHNILLKHAILLDDSPRVLEEVIPHGVRTVSCECFHCESPRLADNRFDDELYIKKNLLQIKKDLIKKVQEILLDMKVSHESSGHQSRLKIGFFHNPAESYKTLGIPEGATQKQIRSAYHHLLNQHRLDDRRNIENFKKVSRAYNSLINFEESDDKELSCFERLDNMFRWMF